MLCPHSVILWLGDLNYRIEELDVEKVKLLIEEKAFQTLYAYDQVQMGTLSSSGSCSSAVGAQSPVSLSPAWEASLRTSVVHSCLHSICVPLSWLCPGSTCVPWSKNTVFVIHSRDPGVRAKGLYVTVFVSAFSKETAWCI